MATKTKQFKKREVPDEIAQYTEDYLVRELLTNKDAAISSDLHAMYDYSPCNCFALQLQCMSRDFQCCVCGAIGKWHNLGRSVLKGQRALWVLHPYDFYLGVNGEHLTAAQKKDPNYPKVKRIGFVWKPTVFAYDQTTGPDVEFPDRGWDISEALWELEVEPVPFSMVEGNCLGYATGRSFAVNPVAQDQLAVTLHELAHIILGHTEEKKMVDGEKLDRTEKEFAAEGTAFLVMNMLGYHDHDKFSRGYCQNWYKSNEVPPKLAKQMNSAAHKILKAGRPKEK